MSKKMVLDLDNHNVYYVKTEDVCYYITIPKKFNTTNICIELKSKMENYNLDMNDEIWVMENVKNTFSFIDNYNITLVLPILNEEDNSILEKLDIGKFEVIDHIMGKTINSAYLNLKEANIQIESQVILINNERFKSFINWFVSRYNSRIICKNLLEVIQTYNVNATTYKKIETPAISFVVGSYNNEVDAPKVIHEPDPKELQQLKPQMSSGFTSYWLLVAITIIVAGVVALLAFLS